jgi:DNA-binding MarR family transcriptional regulator
MSYANDVPTTVVTRNDVDHELIAALRVGVMRLARRLRLERSGSDLTLTQLSALGTLFRYGDLTIGELAAIEKVKPPSMTRTVNALQEAGLVTRAAHESDGRQVVVGLTDAARAVLDEDRRRRDAWLALHLADLEPSERELLRAVAPLLDRMAHEP